MTHLWDPHLADKKSSDPRKFHPKDKTLHLITLGTKRGTQLPRMLCMVNSWTLGEVSQVQQKLQAWSERTGWDWPWRTHLSLTTFLSQSALSRLSSAREVLRMVETGHFSMIHCIVHSGLSYSLKACLTVTCGHCFDTASWWFMQKDPSVNADSTAIGHLASSWFRESLFSSFVLSQLTGNPCSHKLQRHIGCDRHSRKGHPPEKASINVRHEQKAVNNSGSSQTFDEWLITNTVWTVKL